MHDALRQHETGAGRRPRPGQHRIPRADLACDQPFRRRGAIAQQIRAEIFRHLLGHRVRHIRHRVDHRVGEPRQRHARRVDQRRLRVPLLGDFFRERGGRGGKRTARRRLDRFAVKQQREAAVRGLADMRLAIEPLSQCGARAAACRLARVERLVFKDLSENVAHQNDVIVRRNKGASVAAPGRPKARKIAGSAFVSINSKQRFCRPAALLPPLSESEKGL